VPAPGGAGAGGGFCALASDAAAAENAATPSQVIEANRRIIRTDVLLIRTPLQ
jgi:hypothetical protein